MPQRSFEPVKILIPIEWALFTFGEFLAAVLSKLQVIKNQRMTEGDHMELR